MEINLQYFGGRGASSGGGAGKSFSGSITIGMDNIEFEGTLKYGKNDSTVTGATRANIEKWENKRYKAKVEYAYSLDKDGNPISNEVRGGKGSVRTPRPFHDTQDATFSHNHPREDGMLGGTFSYADLKNFAKYGNKTERATAKEGTYSISKTANFNQAGFLAFASRAEAAFQKDSSSKMQAVLNKARQGSLPHSQYSAEAHKAFNSALVNLHNMYLSNQKTYGYEYTLEPRKGG